MSFMSLNGSTGSSTNFWNFSNKAKDNYSTILTGHIVEIQSVPKTQFGSNKIERWDDGNCKRNLRIIVATDSGEVAWDFNPGGKDKRASGGEDKRSTAMKALVKGIVEAVPNANDVDAILGMAVIISTQEPPEGWSYSAGNPRPWQVQINPNSKIEHRGCTIKPDWEKEGGEVDAPPSEPAQVGGPQTASTQFQQAQQQAAHAVASMNVSQQAGVQQPQSVWAQDEMPPASIYDDKIPF